MTRLFPTASSVNRVVRDSWRLLRIMHPSSLSPGFSPDEIIRYCIEPFSVIDDSTRESSSSSSSHSASSSDVKYRLHFMFEVSVSFYPYYLE